MSPEEYNRQRERRLWLSEYPLADYEDVDVDLEPARTRQATLEEVTAE